MLPRTRKPAKNLRKYVTLVTNKMNCFMTCITCKESSAVCNVSHKQNDLLRDSQNIFSKRNQYITVLTNKMNCFIYLKFIWPDAWWPVRVHYNVKCTVYSLTCKESSSVCNGSNKQNELAKNLRQYVTVLAYSRFCTATLCCFIRLDWFLRIYGSMDLWSM